MDILPSLDESGEKEKEYRYRKMISTFSKDSIEYVVNDDKWHIKI